MHGTLVFKYNDLNIKASEMLSIFPVNPLYGALTKKGVNNTFFFVFVKLPEDVHIPFCTRTIEEMDIDAYDIINAMQPLNLRRRKSSKHERDKFTQDFIKAWNKY